MVIMIFSRRRLPALSLLIFSFATFSFAFAANLEKIGGPEIKGRALGGVNATQLVGALDDVSIDEEHQEECVEGQIVDRGCEERCKCIHGSLGCAPRCPLPLLKSGTPSGDPDCFLQPVHGDECCATLICSSEAESESIDGCSHKNQTYKMGQMFHDGCLATCHCHENGIVNCTARCPQQNGTSSDRCLSVEDPKDPCCSILYCDVNTGDELALEEDVEIPKLVSAVPANSSTAMLNFDKLSIVEKVNAEFSVDQKMWKQAKTIGEAVVGLEPGKTYYFRVLSEGGLPSNVVFATLPNSTTNGTSCEFKGKMYKIGEEFHDHCTAYCVCSPSGVECAPINCPTDFGLDVLDPNCLEWETVPSGFKPSPPHCCPQSLVCKNNGSCVYQGVLFENWQDIPDQLSGCKEKCFCSSGNVTCRQRCPTVPKIPPAGLSCSPKQPILGHPPGEECCLTWMCPMVQGKGEGVTNNSLDETSTLVPNFKPVIPFLGPYNPDLLNSKMLSKQSLATVMNKKSAISTVITNGTESKHSNKVNTLITSPPSTSVTDTPDHEIYHPVENIDQHMNNGEGHSHSFEHNLNKIGATPKNQTALNNFPIGVISPNKLLELEKLNEEKYAQSHKKPSLKQQDVNPGFHEHIFEYQEHTNESSQLPSDFPHQISQPFHHNDPVTVPLYNIPFKNQDVNSNPIFPKHTHPTVPNTEFPNLGHYQNSFVHSHNNYEQLIPPKLHHLINQNNFPVPPRENHFNSHPPHQFLPQKELLQNINVGNRLHLNIPPSPYPNYTPLKDLHLFPHSSAPVSFADLIDHIGQHEDTDSRTKDTHVYVLASQPTNTGQESVAVHHIEAIDEGTVRLIFTVPEILVGLHGRIELRYTSELKNNDPSTWEQQVLAPLGDMIATPELEFELKGLQPDTEYKIKITVVGRGLSSSPTSQIYVARTLPAVITTTLPPIIPVEPTMRVAKANSTWATLEWRKFSDYELQFIDGVQLRYKELDGKVYQATPLIHRAVTSYTIEDLKPDSKYEIGIFFIPFPDQSTELQAQKTVFLNTTIENDPYKFLLTLEIHHIKTSSVELTWSGVPYPEDKYVNIFRAIYQYDGGREDMSTFKVAKRDSPMSTLITGLKPETRYRLWLEAYLTNGRIKKSNVKDFTTKVKIYNANEVAEGKLEGTLIQQENNYYGPLVGVSVLAAITSLVAIVLLVIIAKKHGHNKAPITAAVQRKSTPHSAAYDNPSYKSEMQHETMDL